MAKNGFGSGDMKTALESMRLKNMVAFSNTGDADTTFETDMTDASTFSTASGKDYHYVVLQVTLKEKFFGTGSGNLTELEQAINAQAQKGYRLHTISTTNGGSKGLGGGDRIQATMVFEKII